MFSSWSGAIRPEVAAAITGSIAATGLPGSEWSSLDRVAIAGLARKVRFGDAPSVQLPAAAIEVATKVSADPATTSEAWVTAMIGELGHDRYIETVGVAARTVAVDTFFRLLRLELPALPEPSGAGPTGARPSQQPTRGRTWIATVGYPVPPLLLSAVPVEVEAMSTITDTLYMTGQMMDDPDQRVRDLHRTQIEFVAGATSFVNECFF
jgi:hypothetical protein